MRFFLLVLILTIPSHAFAQQAVAGGDPTGTYKQVVRHWDAQRHCTYGRESELRVALLKGSRIAVSFFAIALPGQSSGSFVGTLRYRNRMAVYTTPDYDATCRITFRFAAAGVRVTHAAADYNASCGFGHGVRADGFLKKVSSGRPLIKNQVID